MANESFSVLLLLCKSKPQNSKIHVNENPTEQAINTRLKYLLAFSEGHSSWKSTWCSSNSTPATKKTRRINSPRPLALKYVSLYDFLDIFTTLDKRSALRSIKHSISRERLGKTCHIFFSWGRGSGLEGPGLRLTPLKTLPHFLPFF